MMICGVKTCMLGGIGSLVDRRVFLLFLIGAIPITLPIQSPLSYFSVPPTWYFRIARPNLLFSQLLRINKPIRIIALTITMMLL
ncbi:hypothetical protein BDZ94DRAFT_1252820 [Collybia nuda]|uniref:Uncharacterized protein n=1 Tax=Collybia nuda TaxID=64659 RepID=A0A9P5YC86_9AGAR|nr:hypothetical protein BDZ94DRAFT_1252820 [Collybia nuda]